MADQVMGSIPEFTSDSEPVEPKEPGIQEEQDTTVASESEAEAPVEEPTEEQEKETPSEPPAEETPTEADESQPSGDTRDVREELFTEIDGLKEARKELIHELKDLRGQKRDAKEQELAVTQEEIDKLEDINPDDVNLIDRIGKAKGWVKKQDVDKMFYDARKKEQFDKFFAEYPEYNDDNDPDRRKFGPLLREISLFKEPTDPAHYGKLLRKAHTSISGTSSGTLGGRGTSVKKRQQEIAGVGSGGVQRSSSIQPFDADKRQILRSGGWSEEDIQRMEERANKE